MLSDDKTNQLSHVLADAAAALQGLSFSRGKNEARLRALSLLREGVVADEQLRDSIRERLRNSKRSIPEGGREWDILFRRSYDEEMNRVMPPETAD